MRRLASPDVLASRLCRGCELAVDLVEAVAFWGAVLLPFLYVPAVVAGGTTMLSEGTVAAVLGAHALALVVGHRHNR